MSFAILGSFSRGNREIFIFLFEFGDFGLAELVTDLVVFNSSVALYPVPGNVKAGVEAV